MEKGSFLINKISDTSPGVGIIPLPLCRHRQRCSHPAASTNPRATCWSGVSLLSPSVVVTPLCSLFSSRCFLSIFPFLDPWLGTLPLLGVPKQPPPPSQQYRSPSSSHARASPISCVRPSLPPHHTKGTLRRGVGFKYMTEIKPVWSLSDCFTVVRMYGGSIYFCAVCLPQKLRSFWLIL